VVSGGLGQDTVLYDRRSTGIAASLDGIANDGAPGSRTTSSPTLKSSTAAPVTICWSAAMATTSLTGTAATTTCAVVPETT
jgi:hypothetical protein